MPLCGVGCHCQLLSAGNDSCQLLSCRHPGWWVRSSLPTNPHTRAADAKFERLALSGPPACVETLSCSLIREALRHADCLSVFDGAPLQSSDACSRFWTGKFHHSSDGATLQECSKVPVAQQWVAEGTHLLPGREFIDMVKLRVNTMPNHTHEERTRGEPDVPGWV